MKLRRLISNEPRIGERLEVHAIDAIGKRLYELNFGRPNIASRKVIMQLLEDATRKVQDHQFSSHFLMTEWVQFVDAWQLETREAYRDVRRLGRKTRLTEKQRVMLWSIFEAVKSGLQDLGMITDSYVFSRLASKAADAQHSPFDFIVVDEAQDVSIPQLRFLAALTAKQPSHLGALQLRAEIIPLEPDPVKFGISEIL